MTPVVAALLFAAGRLVVVSGEDFRASASFPIGYGVMGVDMGYLSSGAQLGEGLQAKTSSLMDAGGWRSIGSKGSAGGFQGNQAANSRGQQDGGYYGAGGGANNNYHQGSGYQSGSNYGLAGASEGQEKLADQHKKGHSVKGFQNFHHKDETGKTSTFFDEASDEGEDVQVRGHSGRYGDTGGAAYVGQKLDAAQQSGQGSRQGGYSEGTEGNAGQGQAAIFSGEQHYGDQGNYGQGTAAGDFQKAARYGGANLANYGLYHS